MPGSPLAGDPVVVEDEVRALHESLPLLPRGDRLDAGPEGGVRRAAHERQWCPPSGPRDSRPTQDGVGHACVNRRGSTRRSASRSRARDPYCDRLDPAPLRREVPTTTRGAARWAPRRVRPAGGTHPRAAAARSAVGALARACAPGRFPEEPRSSGGVRVGEPLASASESPPDRDPSERPSARHAKIRHRWMSIPQAKLRSRGHAGGRYT